ncbi:hypothetical protein O181_097010 [Austropuccinia psidii MF-1]|uniref:Uncharacterized protein n=1 Tax=Austropuccinia psidii MF-1 TaxID=1389203 RepID=A0A9Q3J6N5_9BASI|nr:hypothetical protein [Austropuccinia psidii MF-1]
MQDLLLKQSKKERKKKGIKILHTWSQSKATSTPETEPRSQNIPRRVFVTKANTPSTLQQKFSREDRPVVKIKAKDYNLNFDGEEVEKFIKKVERIAQTEGETDEDLAMKMSFWSVSDAIESIPGYEEGNWTQLKKDLITEWGRVEPARRYIKDSLMNLFPETQEDRGIVSLSQYKKFVGEYQTIVTCLLRYRYIPQDKSYHEDLFDCFSADIKGAISKEMIKDNFMVRAEDGGYLIPPMKILKKYIEQELEARIIVTKIFPSTRDKGRNVTQDKEKKVHFKEEAFPGMNEAFSKVKEIN